MLPPPDSRRTYLTGLAGLRGVGAIWVLMYHVQFGLDLPVLENGFLGVDLFFILSGFVLSHANRDMRLDWPSYARFLRDRFARLFPLHWVGLAFVALMLLLCPRIYLSMPGRFQMPELIASVLLVQNWGLPKVAPWNAPAWSLSTEWLVSIGFPVFLFGARRFQRPLAAAAGCAACLLGFAALVYATGNNTPDVQARAGIVRTILEFATGCLLYRVYLSGAQVGSGGTIAACLLLLAGLSAPSRTMLAVFAFPIVVLLSAQASTLTAVLASRPIAFLGKISFSIYLMHWILLQGFNRWGAALGLAGAARAAWLLLYVACALALATLTYHTVENPARRWIRGLRLPAKLRSGRLLQLDR